MPITLRRSSALLAFALACLGAPAARAGVPVVETSLGKTVALKFDLGFKLTCKHEYTIMYDQEGFLEEIKPTELTGDTTFKFHALKVGSVSVTAFFNGPGGECNGSASAQVDVTILPDLKFTEKAWKTDVKDTDKAYRALLKERFKTFQTDLGGIMANFDGNSITSAEAADGFVDAAQFAEDDAAMGGLLALLALSDAGTDLLADGGLTEPPASFQSGARDSLWTAYTYELQQDYDEFVDEVYDGIEDALDDIAKARNTFSYTTYVNGDFPFSLPAGPGVESDPADVVSAPVRIMGGVAYNDGGTGALRWFGTGQFAAGDVAIDVSGPTGFVPQHPLVSQTELGVSAGYGKWSLGVSSLSLTGQYLLQARYDLDEHDDYKITITLPAAPAP
jgi:hypothetical protein